MDCSAWRGIEFTKRRSRQKPVLQLVLAMVTAIVSAIVLAIVLVWWLVVHANSYLEKLSTWPVFARWLVMPERHRGG